VARRLRELAALCWCAGLEKPLCPYWDTEGSNPPSRAALAGLGRYLGALAPLEVGIDHIEQ
jgi:hypothetical protein